MATPKNLFLITARAGSKGVKDKNIRTFGGIPALGMRCISIRKSGIPADIVCSTDSAHYAAIAQKYGARTPFLRPDSLSADGTSSLEVVEHALTWLRTNEGREYETITIVEPSSPFCRPRDIAAGFALYENFRCESVIGVREVSPHPMFSTPIGEQGEYGELGKRLSAQKSLRRQDFPREYTPSGAFYLITTDALRKHGRLYLDSTRAFVMEAPYSMEIDTEIDYVLANALWNSELIDRSLWS